MYNIAIIGAGNIAAIHAAAYSQMEDVRIKTIVDIDIERARVLADEVGACAVTDMEEVCSDPDIAAIDICLPNFLHLETVVQAANAGKNIICEKPIALTVADAKVMFDVCRKKGVQLFIAQVCRFMTAYQEIHELLLNKDLGEPKIVRLSRSVHYPSLIGQDWYKDEQKSGGLFLDFIIHDLDFIVWNFGKPEILSCHIISDENIKAVHIVLQADGGPLITLDGTWSSVDRGGLRQRVEIDGSDGFVDYDDNREIPWVFRNKLGKSKMIAKDKLNQNPFYNELRHFIHCFLMNERSFIKEKEVVDTLKTAILAREVAVNSGKRG
ncbi:Gfo/Idh/MocA family protein [Thalassobacillus pellis]|uniref:Gfo/Idh/MocA family protein n=1 Tax=Thalassobacillus pellis TaxID=748008 RepID=UPI00196203AF|nr:Gfo/Idh/MocA family oxidoreductase [Thalassobacillus pellis]MBM7551586.1 putative dehydrogenase [Thalassobacillus pellis]